MECITDYLPDPHKLPRRQWNIEPEPVEVYRASWVIEKARRMNAKRAQAELLIMVTKGETKDE